KLLESNPGFKSRISNRFKFKDYDANELYNIFLVMTEKQKFVLNDEAKGTVEELIKEAKENNKVDGNGRWVRNLFEKIKMAQAVRLMKEDSSDLQTLTQTDIE